MTLTHQNSGAEEVHKPEMFTIFFCRKVCLMMYSAYKLNKQGDNI